MLSWDLRTSQPPLANLNPEVFCQHILSTRVAPHNPHQLERPSGTHRMPPNPSRLGASSKRTRTSPGFPKGQGWDLQRILVTRVAPPHPFTIWSASPPQHFTLWRGAPQLQGWDPPTLHGLEWLPTRTRMGPPNPARFGGCSFSGG